MGVDCGYWHCSPAVPVDVSVSVKFASNVHVLQLLLKRAVGVAWLLAWGLVRPSARLWGSCPVI